MDGWMDGLVVGNCRPSSSVNPLLLFGLARAEWNMPRQIADPVTFWRSFPPALSFSLDSPCTLFEPVLTVPLSPDSCLKTSSLGDSGTPSRFQLTRPSQVTTSVFLFCRFADPAPSSKPAFATRITCCFFITLQASKGMPHILSFCCRYCAFSCPRLKPIVRPDHHQFQVKTKSMTNHHLPSMSLDAAAASVLSRSRLLCRPLRLG
ncbi:hypothetical protein FSOLCH5_012484 [Fusarium solani]